MTESLAAIVEGPIGTEGVIISAKAGGAIALWASCIVTVAPSTTDPLTVTESSGAAQAVIGIAVGPKLASGKAADASGDKINLCVFGQCKAKVLGKTVNIAVGDGLVSSGTAGKLDKSDVSGADAAAIAEAINTVVQALKASTADDDIIPVFVGRGGNAKTS